MNLKQIQELIKFVAKSGATEVDLEMGDVKICIKSPPKGKIIQNPLPELPVVTQGTPPPVVTQETPPPVVTQSTPIPVVNQNTSLEIDETQNTQHIEIKSPIIGTFYRKPSPDKEPFMNVGDKVEVGSVVGIVEAMKLFNEIESEVSGTIIKVLVDDMSPVEYDQPLFLVDKN